MCFKAKAWVSEKAAIAKEALCGTARDIMQTMDGRVASGLVDLVGSGRFAGHVGPLEVCRCQAGRQGRYKYNESVIALRLDISTGQYFLHSNNAA
jgi:hypothetical protein